MTKQRVRRLQMLTLKPPTVVRRPELCTQTKGAPGPPQAPQRAVISRRYLLLSTESGEPSSSEQQTAIALVHPTDIRRYTLLYPLRYTYLPALPRLSHFNWSISTLPFLYPVSASFMLFFYAFLACLALFLVRRPFLARLESHPLIFEHLQLQ